MAALNLLIEGALRRDRLLVVCALLTAIALSWAYLFAGAGMSMHEMDGMLMPMRTGPWTPGYASLVLIMWAVMMGAMMLPSAAPMILLYSTIARRRSGDGKPASSAGFMLGYVVVWGAYSAAAAGLQYGLEQTALLSPMMEMTSIAFAGAVLIAAGAYQWTSLKQACLRRCRSPLEFLAAEWREGRRGAFVMGLRHGAYCVGCCWMLMLLLFVGGVMNLAWIIGLALFVLIEKLVPAGHWVGRAAGLGLIAWGAATLAAL